MRNEACLRTISTDKELLSQRPNAEIEKIFSYCHILVKKRLFSRGKKRIAEKLLDLHHSQVEYYKFQNVIQLNLPDDVFFQYSQWVNYLLIRVSMSVPKLQVQVIMRLSTILCRVTDSALLHFTGASV